MAVNTSHIVYCCPNLSGMKRVARIVTTKEPATHKWQQAITPHCIQVIRLLLIFDRWFVGSQSHPQDFAISPVIAQWYSELNKDALA